MAAVIRVVGFDDQVGLTGWYAAYGFVVAGHEFDEDGVRHAPMERART